MKPEPRMPNFILAGAPCCGTTSVSRYLSQHPDIFMSSPKEPNFFHLYKQPGSKLKDRNPGRVFVETCEDYMKLFGSEGREKIAGEATASYFYDAQACRNMKELIPDIRILILLCDPMDRANSSFMKNRLEQRERHPSFKAAVESEMSGGSADYLKGEPVQSLPRGLHAANGSRPVKSHAV